MAGGNLLLLLQWSEFVIIGGASLGALLISTPMPVLKKIVHYILSSFKSAGHTQQNFVEMLQLLYELFQTARVKGLLHLEPHVEKPEESDLFAKYPIVRNNHHALEYITDSLKLLVVGGVPALELEMILDADL